MTQKRASWNTELFVSWLCSSLFFIRLGQSTAPVDDSRNGLMSFGVLHKVKEANEVEDIEKISKVEERPPSALLVGVHHLK